RRRPAQRPRHAVAGDARHRRSAEAGGGPPPAGLLPHRAGRKRRLHLGSKALRGCLLGPRHRGPSRGGPADHRLAMSLPPAVSSYEQEILRWREWRRARLTAPEGWLSVIALERLAEGENTVGSDPSNRVVLP